MPAGPRVVAGAEADDRRGQQGAGIAGPAQHRAHHLAGQQRRDIVEFLLERGGLDEQTLDRRRLRAPGRRLDGEVAVVFGKAAGERARNRRPANTAPTILRHWAQGPARGSAFPAPARDRVPGRGRPLASLSSASRSLAASDASLSVDAVLRRVDRYQRQRTPPPPWRRSRRRHAEVSAQKTTAGVPDRAGDRLRLLAVEHPIERRAIAERRRFRCGRVCPLLLTV